LLAPRKDDETPSPNAYKIGAISSIARRRTERDGKRLLDQHLFYQEATADNKLMLAITEDQNMAKQMLPPSISQLSSTRLKTPQVDTTVGYICNDDVRLHNNHASRHNEHALLEAVFTTQEAEALKLTSITQGVDLPWFTCQWKSAMNKGTHFAAQTQGARNGAALLTYNHKLLAGVAFDRDDPIVSSSNAPSPEESIHFSGTTDLETVMIYVHWIELDEQDTKSPAIFRMEKIFTCDLDDETAVRTVRRLMKNLYDWAIHTRLPRYKEALAVRFEALKAHPNLALDTGNDEDQSEQTESVLSAGSRSLSSRATPHFAPTPGTSNSQLSSNQRNGKRRKGGETV
jgi:hypothetical protein